MILSSTSDIVRIVTSSTADIHAQASWTDITTTSFTPGRTNTVITSATTTTIVASPGSSTQRQVKTLRLYNAHASTTNTVTVQHYDGTTSNTVFKHDLLAGESVTYDGQNWSVFSSAGIMYTTVRASLTADVTGVLPVANGGTNASSASITAFNNITGYTAAGATGTTSTNLVFSTSPTLVTPALGTPSSGTLTNCTGLPAAQGTSLVLLGSATASTSASLDFTSLISSTYDIYILTGTLRPATDGAALYFRTSSNNGVAWDSGGTDYKTSGVLTTSGSTTVNGNSSTGRSEGFVGGTTGNAATSSGCFMLTMHNVNSTSKYKIFTLQSGNHAASGEVSFFNVSETRQSASAVNAIQVFASTGNLTDGTVYLYGVKKS